MPFALGAIVALVALRIAAVLATPWSWERWTEGPFAVPHVLSYMSPEVLRGGRAGEADDVWSLCVVLYEMVAGRRPFIGDDAAEIAGSVRQQRIRPLAAEVGQTDQAGFGSSAKLIAFVASVLTAGPAARPAAGAFADALPVRGLQPRQGHGKTGRAGREAERARASGRVATGDTPPPSTATTSALR